MDRKIPWLKIAVAAAVVATTAVGIALFIKKKLDELRLREEEYDFFDDECEFCDSYNPMDEVMTNDEYDIVMDEDSNEEQPTDAEEATENSKEEKEF